MRWTETETKHKHLGFVSSHSSNTWKLNQSLDLLESFLTCKSVCTHICKCKRMICLNMAFLYMCEHVIICIHTCVSALITNIFAWSSSASELTPTWLCETLALIGPTYNNYRLSKLRSLALPVNEPSHVAFFFFSSGGGSDLTWAIGSAALWSSGARWPTITLCFDFEHTDCGYGMESGLKCCSEKQE